ncbi:MAG: hypothetical protein U5K27_02115 [Desulfotignum sp.]|nr:hypothetical protein [Desulfotignum sp.]
MIHGEAAFLVALTDLFEDHSLMGDISMGGGARPAAGDPVLNQGGLMGARWRWPATPAMGVSHRRRDTQQFQDLFRLFQVPGLLKKLVPGKIGQPAHEHILAHGHGYIQGLGHGQGPGQKVAGDLSDLRAVFDPGPAPGREEGQGFEQVVLPHPLGPITAMICPFARADLSEHGVSAVSAEQVWASRRWG